MGVDYHLVNKEKRAVLRIGRGRFMYGTDLGEVFTADYDFGWHEEEEDRKLVRAMRKWLRENGPAACVADYTWETPLEQLANGGWQVSDVFEMAKDLPSDWLLLERKEFGMGGKRFRATLEVLEEVESEREEHQVLGREVP